MSSKKSRRELLAKGALAGAGLVAADGLAADAQEPRHARKSRTTRAIKATPGRSAARTTKG